LEFRAGRIQDVLPPSIHPATQRPYRWETPPINGFPPLPTRLLELWQDFDAFARRARRLCPWAEPEPQINLPRAVSSRPRTGPSVIAEFNAAHSPVAILEARGYTREGKRLRAPGSQTHGAGVQVLPDGRVRCWHWSDALGDGKPHDAFDLFAMFDHGGDTRAAVKAAAALLGMDRRGNAA
jgi:putative DNA primase/helicase